MEKSILVRRVTKTRGLGVLCLAACLLITITGEGKAEDLEEKDLSAVVAESSAGEAEASAAGLAKENFSSGFKGVGAGFKNGAVATGNGFKWLGHKMGDGFKTAGRAIGTGFKKFGGAVKGLFSKDDSSDSYETYQVEERDLRAENNAAEEAQGEWDSTEDWDSTEEAPVVDDLEMDFEKKKKPQENNDWVMKASEDLEVNS